MEAAAALRSALSSRPTGPASCSSASSSSSSLRSAASPTPAAGRQRRQSRAHTTSGSGSSRSSASSRRHSSSGGSDAALNLPLGHEFLPLPHDQEEEEEAAGDPPADAEAAARDHVRHDVLCMLFDLPKATVFYQDFSCAIAASLPMHGRMYPTSTHVCFYSNVFGRERKILIPYESISELAKTTTMVFQNAIRLRTTDGQEDYTFASFWGTNRDSCFDLIAKTRERVLQELRPTVLQSFKRVASGSPTARTFIRGGGGHEGAPAATGDAGGSPRLQEDEEEAQPSAETPTTASEATTADAQAPTVAANSGEASEELARPTRQRQRSVVSDVDRIAPKDISMTRILEETFPVTVDAFMAAFFLDGAPFGMDTFGERTGATEMTVNPWMTPLEDDEAFGMTRSLQFRVPVEAPIGPKSSRVDVLQCMKEERNVRVVETSTRLADIPYGDYFSVEDRWTVVPHGEDAGACQVAIELKVVFGKSTFWKSTIESRAISDNKDKWTKWVGMAKAFLEAQGQQTPSRCTDSEAVESQATEARLPRRQSSGHSATGDTSAPAISRRRSGRAGSVGHQDRPRASQLHRSSSSHSRRARAAGAGSMGSRNVPVKVFPWILVLVLLLVVVRLQATLSTIEASLELTARRVALVQEQLAHLQAAACPAQPFVQ